jgi:hypothetical protein
MFSGKDVRGSKKLDVKRLILSVIFFASISQATRICTASDWSDADSPSDWAAAKDAELDELRGGFMLDNGMVVDLSLATSVFVNGQEQFSDRFDLADDFSMDQLRGVAVNNSAGNLAISDAGMSNMAVIQNTMDNQLITMVRSIDITLSNIKGLGLSGIESSGFPFAP